MHIDVGAILATTARNVYMDLVTRPTGRLVRTHIEGHIAGQAGTLAIIDFSRVGFLDFSCADEIVASLMRQCCADLLAPEQYLIFSGISADHLDAIEHVLERQRLALVVRFSNEGTPCLVGVVHETERQVWDAVRRLQPATSGAIVAETGLGPGTVAECLAALQRRRLLMQDGPLYHVPVGPLA
jgi:hypothetical protein